MNTRKSIHQLIVRPLGFLLRVLNGFRRNQGFLLAGAVAYYTLLSIVPMSILALVVLTHFIEEQNLLHTLSTYMDMVIPGYSVTLTDQARQFLEDRKVVGVIGFMGMLLFSSLTFSMLENAMSVIFLQRVKMPPRRNFIVSALLPYMYISLIGTGIVLVSFIVGACETLQNRHLKILGWTLNLGDATGTSMYILGIVGEVLMLTSIYLVMPVVRVRFSHALIGGISAAVLWEITRRVMIWWYASISMINIIYGSIAITVAALISIEIVMIILLLGAQVIAELQNTPDQSTGEKQHEFKT